jgi:hypothetical protein
VFTDLDKNKEMLLGSYKKLKSYYHYNKNFVFMKKKIAELEADEKHMLKVLENLAQLLADPDAEVNTQQIDDWLGKIDFYVMPKSFTSNSVKNELFISAESNEEKEVNKVNFFIDMPIELHLLETLWTVLIGKLVFEKKLVSAKSYGNAIDDYVLYNKQDDFLDSINFTKNKLFKIYFPQYCNWKNDAIETVATLNRFNRSQMLFSLDVKSFYYSVVWKFDLLDDKMGDDERYKALKFLNLIIQRIFERYTGIVNEYRILEQCIENKEYILPIGLFSSMLLANVYMYELDNDISQNPNVLHYGRYVDDIILVVDVTGDEKNISEDNAFDRYLVEKNNILVNVES